MQLRNRQILSQAHPPPKSRRAGIRKPFHISFESFSRLPTEIRHMIWRLALQPRIVEIETASDDKSFDTEAGLPSALLVCRDSRAAVIESYPFCFHSRSKAPKIRFNLSLDTLLISGHFNKAVFHLLDILTDKELSDISHIAFEEIVGWDEDDYTQERVWENLETAMDNFTGLEEIIVAIDVFQEVIPSDEEADKGIGHCYQFFDNFPEELLQCKRRSHSDLEKRFTCVEEWTTPKLKLMWGWRREKYPRYV